MMLLQESEPKSMTLNVENDAAHDGVEHWTPATLTADSVRLDVPGVPIAPNVMQWQRKSRRPKGSAPSQTRCCEVPSDHAHLVRKCCGVTFSPYVECIGDDAAPDLTPYMKNTSKEEEKRPTNTTSKPRQRSQKAKLWRRMDVPFKIVDRKQADNEMSCPLSGDMTDSVCHEGHHEEIASCRGDDRSDAGPASPFDGKRGGGHGDRPKCAIDRESGVELLDAKSKSCAGGSDAVEGALGGRDPGSVVLQVLTRKEPGHLCISNVEDPDPGWTEIEVTIDSGACDTVMPTRMCQHISIVASEDSKRGMEYELANGETIPNVGERHCMLMTEDSQIAKRITFQCADIHKPLLSVSRCADLGYQCVLGRGDGELVDETSGEIIPLHRRGNLYVMRAWIRQDKSTDFARPR